MVLVKIKRESIKRNPNAFSTSTTVSKGKTIRFRIEGMNELPDFLVEGESAFVTSQGWGDSFDSNYVEGYLRDDTFVEQVLKIEGATVKWDNNLRTYHHQPEREYFYDYEDAEVTCSNCERSVRLSEIIDDTLVTDEDEYNIEKCPHCGATDSFEREYEKVADVIKERKH